MKKLPKLSDKRSSICGECATIKGAVWPEGHCATFWPGTCDYCGKKKALCDIGDYEWPKNKRKRIGMWD